MSEYFVRGQKDGDEVRIGVSLEKGGTVHVSLNQNRYFDAGAEGREPRADECWIRAFPFYEDDALSKALICARLAADIGEDLVGVLREETLIAKGEARPDSARVERLMKTALASPGVRHGWSGFIHPDIDWKELATYYDVRLERVLDGNHASFEWSGGKLGVTDLSTWPHEAQTYVGKIGVLRHTSHNLASGKIREQWTFHPYYDQTLRRAYELDQAGDQIGWRNSRNSLGFTADRLIELGVGGAFIPKRTDTIILEVPQEFTDFCALHGSHGGVREMLTRFMTDAAGLKNRAICPREDGLDRSENRQPLQNWLAEHYGIEERVFLNQEDQDGSWKLPADDGESAEMLWLRDGNWILARNIIELLVLELGVKKTEAIKVLSKVMPIPPMADDVTADGKAIMVLPSQQTEVLLIIAENEARQQNIPLNIPGGERLDLPPDFRWTAYDESRRILRELAIETGLRPGSVSAILSRIHPEVPHRELSPEKFRELSRAMKEELSRLSEHFVQAGKLREGLPRNLKICFKPRGEEQGHED